MSKADKEEMAKIKKEMNDGIKAWNKFQKKNDVMYPTIKQAIAGLKTFYTRSYEDLNNLKQLNSDKLINYRVVAILINGKDVDKTNYEGIKNLNIQKIREYIDNSKLEIIKNW